MNEKKLDAIMRFVTASTQDEQERIIEEIRGLMDVPPQQPVVQKPNLQARIYSVLAELGVPASLKGHRCLVEALKIAVNDPDILEQMTKRLYVETGKACNTTASRTERAIRHAIEVAWERGNLETIHRYFGYTVSSSKGKPTNSEFIAQLVYAIRLQEVA